MLRIAVIVANGTEDTELVVPVDIWRRAGLIVKLISIEKKKNVVLAHGCKISCDEILSKENLSKHNAIFLPGGPGYKMFNEKDTPKLVAFVKKFANDKKTTFMSICAATKCYADWGVLGHNKVTCYPDIDKSNFQQNYVKQDVVVSNNFITASGPGVASDFAFTVVEKLVSPNKAKDIAKKMLYKW